MIVNPIKIKETPNHNRMPYIIISKPIYYNSYCIIQMGLALWSNSYSSIFVLNKNQNKWNIVYYNKYRIE